MSGMSFEGVARADGQYGFVAFSQVSSLPALNNVLIFTLPQIYSVTRVATLMSVILNLVGLNVTRPINCQVSPVSHACLVNLSGQL